MIPTLVLVSFLVFLILHLLPSDPVEVMLAEVAADAEDYEQLRESLGLNDPFLVQYGRFLWNAVRGDFGRSFFNNRPVMDLIRTQLPSTIQLTFAGMGVAIVFGVTLGTVAALRHNTWIDNLVMAVAVTSVSTPLFWQGLLFISFFAVYLGWLPALGQEGLKGLILPAATLGTGAAGTIARLTRGSVLEIVREDFVTVARAKGLGEKVVVSRHIVRNALIPVVTVIGLQFGALLGGAVVTETVFARQGVGRLLVDAILHKDFPLVQGTVFIASLAYLSANFVVDLLYLVIDPRIQVS
jgi:peptide/nickel transport system permease protein